MLLLSTILVVSLVGLSSTSPGASWSEEESLIVKAKLYAILGDNEGGSSVVNKQYLPLYPELGYKKWPEVKSYPSAGKFLRLGFHQCLKYSDGSGGCNGCLNNHNLGLENRHTCGRDERRRDIADLVKTDNAGLELTADVLEEIFTNKDFPYTAVPLDVSLAESGKSRADLWSFAAAVAVEWGIDRNNNGCDGADTVGDLVSSVRAGLFDGIYLQARGCLHLRGTDPQCKIELPAPIKFYTGRSDCAPEAGLKSWMTTKEEHHPNPQGNGQMTADFLKEDFGLTGRESAALLLGSHSLGTFNFVLSQFKYDWTRNQGSMLNNQVFRNIAMKDQYFLECRDDNPLVGDHLGQPAVTRWKVLAQECGLGGGPYQWFHQYHRCPASNTCSGLSPSEALSTRTPFYPYPDTVDRSGATMRSEPKTPARCCENLAVDQKCQESCERFIQNAETAMSVDAGYYFDFTVDPATGRPGGCAAFDQLETKHRSKVVDCGLNEYAPEGEALHKIVDEFADHQDKWIADFLAAFDKMSKNGNADLSDGPQKWFGAKCKTTRVRGVGKVWSCE